MSLVIIEPRWGSTVSSCLCIEPEIAQKKHFNNKLKKKMKIYVYSNPGFC